MNERNHKAIEAAVKIIILFEGLRFKPYYCSARVATIGYGTTRYPDGTAVSMDDYEIDEPTAREYLIFEIKKAMCQVERIISVPLTYYQLAALISFVYNLGAGSLAASTLKRKLNRDLDYDGAAAEFGKWVYAKGQRLRGLERRRAAETKLFEGA